MYVKNSGDVNAKKAHCGKVAAKYFSGNGLPVFGKEDGKTIFLNTKKFEVLYKIAPLWVKLGVSIK